MQLHSAWLLEDAPGLIAKIKKHRHVLLAPVFFLITALMLRSASLTADVLPAMPAADTKVHQLDGGRFNSDGTATYTEQDGHLSFHGGALSLVADGLLRISLTQSGSLAAWNGGVSVLQDGHALTVAAISSPAVVRFGSGIMLVPVGMQWRHPLAASAASGAVLPPDELSGALLPLPGQYLSDQRQILSSLPPAGQTTDASSDPTTGDVLAGKVPPADPVAMERTEIQTLLQAGNTYDLSGLLRRDGDRLFSGGEGQKLLAQVLAGLSQDEPVVPQMQGFLDDADLRLLYALHPLSRSQGFMLYDGPPADHTALLLAFPQSDVLPDAIPEWIMDRWQRDTAQMILRDKEPLSALDRVLSSLSATNDLLRLRGFTDRLQRYSLAAQAFARPYLPLLGDERKAVLQDIAAAPPAPQIDDSAQTSSASSLPPLTADEAGALVNRVRGELLSHGGMLTKNSGFAPVSAREVDVQNVVFATNGRDEMFSFAYDPTDDTLSSIIRSGVTQSYSVTLEAFLSWIRK